MNSNSNIVLLLLSVIIVILASVSYLEFKKIKIELDKHKEILSNYKEKIELLLDLNKKIVQENNYNHQDSHQPNHQPSHQPSHQYSQEQYNQPIYQEEDPPIQVQEVEEEPE